MAAIFSSVRSSQRTNGNAHPGGRGQRTTRSGVTTTSTWMSCSVVGTTPSSSTCSGWTVVTTIVCASTSPASAATASSRSLKPPPLPSRAPDSSTATQPVTTRSTGSSSSTSTVRALRDAPLIELAVRGSSASCGGVEQEERVRLGQAGHRHVDDLAVDERALAHRPLRRVGVRLHGRGRGPFGVSRRGGARPPRRPRSSGSGSPASGSGPPPAGRGRPRPARASAAFAASSAASPPASWS